MDDVADVHQAQSHPSAHRGRDARVKQVQLLHLNQGLVGANRSLKLPDLCALCVELLLGNHALFVQGLKSFQIGIGILEGSLILE